MKNFAEDPKPAKSTVHYPKKLMSIAQRIADDMKITIDEVLQTMENGALIRYSEGEQGGQNNERTIHRSRPLRWREEMVADLFRWFAHNPQALQIYTHDFIIGTGPIVFISPASAMIRYQESQQQKELTGLSKFYTMYLWKITGYADGLIMSDELTASGMSSKERQAQRHTALAMMYSYHLPLKHPRIEQPQPEQVWYNEFLDTMGEPRSAQRLQALCRMMEHIIFACLSSSTQSLQRLLHIDTEPDPALLYKLMRCLHRDKQWLLHRFGQ